MEGGRCVQFVPLHLLSDQLITWRLTCGDEHKVVNGASIAAVAVNAWRKSR
jgi:hypothetical protein